MFSYFDIIFCINLDSRPDRWDECVREFSKLNLTVRRMPGVVVNVFPGNPKRNACVGNHFAHANCIKKARELGAKNCLIFEDDVTFLDTIHTTLQPATTELPKDFELFYLGVNVERPCYQVTPHLARLTFAFATHAYCINSTVYDEIEDICRDTSTIHNDVWYNDKVIPRGKSYCTVPLVAIQRTSYSDIERNVTSYNWMLERFKNNLMKGKG